MQPKLLKLDPPGVELASDLVDAGFDRASLDELRRYADGLWGNFQRYNERLKINSREFPLIEPGLRVTFDEWQLASRALEARLQESITQVQFGEFRLLAERLLVDLGRRVAHVAQLTDFDNGSKVAERISAAFNHTVEIPLIDHDDILLNAKGGLVLRRATTQDLDIVSHVGKLSERIKLVASWLTDLASFPRSSTLVAESKANSFVDLILRQDLAMINALERKDFDALMVVLNAMSVAISSLSKDPLKIG